MSGESNRSYFFEYCPGCNLRACVTQYTRPLCKALKEDEKNALSGHGCECRHSKQCGLTCSCDCHCGHIKVYTTTNLTYQ
jgi:hypothetical protein